MPWDLCITAPHIRFVSLLAFGIAVPVVWYSSPCYGTLSTEVNASAHVFNTGPFSFPPFDMDSDAGPSSANANAATGYGKAMAAGNASSNGGQVLSTTSASEADAQSSANIRLTVNDESTYIVRGLWAASGQSAVSVGRDIFTNGSGKFVNYLDRYSLFDEGFIRGRINIGASSFSNQMDGAGSNADASFRIEDLSDFCPVSSTYQDVVLPRIEFNLAGVKGNTLNMNFQELPLDFAVSRPSDCLCAATGSGSLPVSFSMGPLEVPVALSSTTATVKLLSNGTVMWQNNGFDVTPYGFDINIGRLDPMIRLASVEELGVSFLDSFETIVRVAESYFHRTISDELFSIFNDIAVIGDPGTTEMQITSPDGKLIGINADGQLVNEIPGAAFFETDAGPISVFALPESGNYATTLRSTADGPFELVTLRIVDGQVVVSESLFGSLSNGESVDSISILDDDSNLTTRFVNSTQLPGDYNNNGVVEAGDYTVWRDNFGADDVLSGNGDENGLSAGIVDGADYLWWKSNFGRIAGRGGTVTNGNGISVPEPNTMLLAIFIVLTFEMRSLHRQGLRHQR